jgi:carboxymethylenebutenolidase
MKTLFLLTFTLPLSTYFSQSCCTRSSTETFAMLTNDEAFIASHLEPEAFTLADPIGKNITFKAADGRDAYAYEIKAAEASKNYVFVFHEWWGLNDYIKQESEKIYRELGNVNVIAIDLYDGKVATTRDSAAAYMQAVTTERAEAIIKGSLKHVGKKADIATIGWCFGGGWSLQAAILAGNQAEACIMYYGMPEKDLSKLKKLYAPVLFIWPEQDKWINKDVVDEFQKNMRKAGKDYEIHSYDADHAFANPSNPKYSKAFADDAFIHAMKLIKKELD